MQVKYGMNQKRMQLSLLLCTGEFPKNIDDVIKLSLFIKKLKDTFDKTESNKNVSRKLVSWREEKELKLSECHWKLMAVEHFLIRIK
ncbi:unnamed protein product [Chironomus riparius]|uniref:Uncharacterized protein n=1 Tax=Chironomus riparius TaxID=315576 RepID=A0A9N9S6Y9_9DIPT|nr:unnamed protein product [Chironomus riparius]